MPTHAHRGIGRNLRFGFLPVNLQPLPRLAQTQAPDREPGPVERPAQSIDIAIDSPGAAGMHADLEHLLLVIGYLLLVIGYLLLVYLLLVGRVDCRKRKPNRRDDGHLAPFAPPQNDVSPPFSLYSIFNQ